MQSSHHYLWILFAFCALALLAYIGNINRPDTYEKGSYHGEINRQDWPLSIHIGESGCARLGLDRKKK